jgi:hypothetical protein
MSQSLNTKTNIPPSEVPPLTPSFHEVLFDQASTQVWPKSLNFVSEFLYPSFKSDIVQRLAKIKAVDALLNLYNKNTKPPADANRLDLVNYAKYLQHKFEQEKFAKLNKRRSILDSPTNVNMGETTRKKRRILVGVELNPGPPKPINHEKMSLLKKKIKDATEKKIIVDSLIHRKGISIKDNNNFQTTAAPANTSFKYVAKQAVTRSIKNGTNVRHTEYIGDLTASSTASLFQCNSYILNSGNSSLFAWLSLQALSYGMFKFNSLKFHIESSVGTGTNGMYGLATSPDCKDLLPTTKSAFLQYENASRANVWAHCDHRVSNDILKRLPAYLMSPTTSAQTDTTRSLGQLFVCSSGMTAGLAFGELYASYDVDLTFPQTSIAEGNQSNWGSSIGSPFLTKTSAVENGIISNATSYTGAVSQSILQVTMAGDFMVFINFAGTNISTTTPTYVFYDNNGVILTSRILINIYSVNSAQTVSTQLLTISNMPNPWYFSTNGPSAASLYTTTVLIARYNATGNLTTPPATINRIKDDYVHI